MKDKVRSWKWVCVLLQACVLFVLAGCDRSSQSPNPRPAGGDEQARTVAAPPPPGQSQLPPQSEPGPIEKYLFPPDLIMVHQREIGIRDEQREEIVAAVQEAQSKIMRLQWEMHEAMGQLEQDLENAHIDEAKTLSTSESITKIEGEIKRTHLAMLIRIKNRLSEQQQRQLSDLRLAHSPQPRR